MSILRPKCEVCGYEYICLGGVMKPCPACELLKDIPEDMNKCSECGEIFDGGYEEPIAICDGCLESKEEDMGREVA